MIIRLEVIDARLEATALKDKEKEKEHNGHGKDCAHFCLNFGRWGQFTVPRPWSSGNCALHCIHEDIMVWECMGNAVQTNNYFLVAFGIDKQHTHTYIYIRIRTFYNNHKHCL